MFLTIILLFATYWYFWIAMYNYLIVTYHYHNKIANNIISLYHACICIMYLYFVNTNRVIENIINQTTFNTTFILSALYYSLSKGYFLYDLNYLLKVGSLSDNALFIVHHLAVFYVYNVIQSFNLQTSTEQEITAYINNIYSIYLYSELSNLPNYLVYHLLHYKYNNYIVFIAKIYQVLHYGFFRVYKNIGVTILFFPYLSQTHQVCIILFNTMGVIWTYKLAFGVQKAFTSIFYALPNQTV